MCYKFPLHSFGMSASSDCHLSQLPAELRSQVYGHLFQDAHIRFSQEIVGKGPEPFATKWSWTRHNTHVAILATCTSIRREAGPMFWDMFEMFIPSQMLYELRDYGGLWSVQGLEKIISLRPQLYNIALGFSKVPPSQCSLIRALAEVSSFVTDLRYYACLKRLTLTYIDNQPKSYFPNGSRQPMQYQNLTDKQRQTFWQVAKNNCRIMLLAPESFYLPEDQLDLFSPLSGSCWFQFWAPVLSLIMRWRSDPVKLNILGSHVIHNGNIAIQEDRVKAMSFRIFYQHYEQLQYELSGSQKCKGLDREFGTLPPLIHEIEVMELDHTPTFELKEMRLVGEHRAFWEQSNPPEHLIDVRNIQSSHTSYPFWISEEPDIISEF